MFFLKNINVSFPSFFQERTLALMLQVFLEDVPSPPPSKHPHPQRLELLPPPPPPLLFFFSSSSVSDENDTAGRMQVQGLSALKSELHDAIMCNTQLVTLRIPSACKDTRHERQLKINSFYADLRDGGRLDDRDKRGRRASLQFLAEHEIMGQIAQSIDLAGKLTESLGNDVNKWTSPDVLDWLTVIGVANCCIIFEEAQVGDFTGESSW